MINSLSYVDDYFPYGTEDKIDLKVQSDIENKKNEENHDRLKSLKLSDMLEDMQQSLLQLSKVLQNNEGIASLKDHLKGLALFFIFASVILLCIYEYMS